MSNGIDVGPALLMALQLVFLLIWGGIAGVLLRKRGLLRLDVVLGRVRMAPEENPWILAVIGVVAITTGAIAGQVVVAAWEVPAGWAVYVQGIVLSVVGAAAVVAGLKLLRVDGLERIGLRWRELDRSILWGILALLAVLPTVYLVGIIANAVAGAMGRSPEPHDLLTSLGQTGNWWAIATFVSMAVLLAPLLEELVFRGLMQTFLTRLLTGPAEGELPVGTRVQGRWQSILITSLLFAAIHGEPAFMPPLFVLSVGLGVAYERTGSLWTPMVMHALFNGVQVVLFLLVMGGMA